MPLYSLSFHSPLISALPPSFSLWFYRTDYCEFVFIPLYWPGSLPSDASALAPLPTIEPDASRYISLAPRISLTGTSISFVLTMPLYFAIAGKTAVPHYAKRYLIPPMLMHGNDHCTGRFSPRNIYHLPADSDSDTERTPLPLYGNSALVID